MRPQAGVEGGRTLGTTDGEGTDGRGAQDGAEQTESQGDIEDSEGLGRASGSGD